MSFNCSTILTNRKRDDSLDACGMNAAKIHSDCTT